MDQGLSKEAQRVFERALRLYTPKEVEAALDRLAAGITQRLGGTEPLLLCVMIGGLIPTAKLLQRLRFPLQVDYIHATRYGDSTQGGELRWVARPSEPLEGRTVLLVDDILDQGVTLAALAKACREAGAKEVLSAVLLDKRIPEKRHRADFVGLPVENRYVFGYGMDYKGFLRNAPGIFAVEDA